ncbi:hypothetical protein JTB14_000619 [Gonioctena quinquepunctata]|nr:hypothetical protein JTB14_000619 [Gonioctena quinquepunctata]
MVNSSGKNTLENLSMLMALLLCLYALLAADCAGFGALSSSEFSLETISKTLLGGGVPFLGGGLGASESPNTMFTRQYSIRAMKTKL